MFKVHDIMTTNVVTVTPEATLREAASLILRHGVSGLPVVDDDDQLVGVLSEWDLLEVLESPEKEADAVGDYMTREPLSVGEESSLVDVVDMFQTKRVRRLPVTDGNRLVGVVSRHDVIRFVLTTRDRFVGRSGRNAIEDSSQSDRQGRKNKSTNGGKCSSSMFA